MDYNRTLHTLLEHSCPSIKYRIRRELLGEETDTSVMRNLQIGITTNGMVKTALAYQKPSGKFGEVFHSGIDFNLKTQSVRPGAEGIFRFLSEMGLSTLNPRFQMAIESLQNDDWFGEKKGVCWVYYPEHNMYGLDFVRSVTLAQLATEEEYDFSEFVSHAIQVLAELTEFESYEDLTSTFDDRGRIRLVFRDGVRFPEIYHLKLLAYTSSWRTKEQRKIVLKGVQRIVDLSPIRSVKVLHKRMCLGPATIYPSNLRIDLRQLTDGGWNRNSWSDWFHTFDLFARMGVVEHIPELRRQAVQLMEILDEGDGFFNLKLTEKHFRRWTIYTGAALEDRWTDESRKWDLTFRSMLILYHSGLLDAQSVNTVGTSCATTKTGGT